MPNVPAAGFLQSLDRTRRKSASSQGVPRAVFIGLLRKGPRKSSDSPVEDETFRRGPDPIARL